MGEVEHREGDTGRPAPAAPRAGAGTLSVRSQAASARDSSEERGAGRRRRDRRTGGWRSSRRERENLLVLAVVCTGALAGALVSDAAPTGTTVVDHVVVGASVGIVSWAASAARRWTWIVLAGIALAAAGGDAWALGLAFAALALTILTAGPVRPQPAVGAVVGALGAIALLRIGDLGPLGFPVLVAAVAVGPVLVSGYRHASRRTRRRARWAVLAGLAFVGIAGVAYGVAVASARSDAERGLTQLDAGMAAARNGDDGAAADRLDAAADAFGQADDSLGGWLAAPARMLPIVGHNARATAEMAGSAEDVARAGAVSASDADTDSLTVDGGRLDLERVRQLEGPLDDVAVALATAQVRLDDTSSPWLVAPIADRLDRVRTELADARPEVDLAADAVAVLPEMFGGDGEPSRWFVAFVTPVEARGRTGFLGNFAELTAVDGQVEMTRFGRAGELEADGTPGAARTLSGPEDYVERYARFAPAATWRNVTMSPDFPSVGQVIAELYPQSGGQPIDGVIAVDPAGLAALMAFTGPIDVPATGEVLTADNAADFLLRGQYIELPDNAARTDALEDLSRTTFDRLTSGNLPGPRQVADVLGGPMDAGHLHVWAADAAQQDVIEQVGLDGGLPPGDGGDSLAVVSNNAIGNKVDLFLQRTIAYEAVWDPETGAVGATATVTLTNSAPTAGLPDYVIGTSLAEPDPIATGTNRTYLSVYSPHALESATLDGQPVEIERQRERGRYVYSLFLDVPPAGGSRTVELRLDGGVDPGERYALDVAGQPLATPDQVSVMVQAVGAGEGDVSASAPLAVSADRASASGPVAAERTSYVVRASS